MYYKLRGISHISPKTKYEIWYDVHMTDGIIKYIVRDIKYPFLKGLLLGIGLKTNSQKELDNAFIHKQMNLVRENNYSIDSYFKNVAKYLVLSIEQYEQSQTQ